VTPGRLREHLRVYAELRRAVGIPLGRNVLVLGEFVDYPDEQYDSEPVTTQLALDWVDDWSGKHKISYPGAVLTLVRQFLMYVSSAIEGTDVPDIGLLAAKKRGNPVTVLLQMNPTPHQIAQFTNLEWRNKSWRAPDRTAPAPRCAPHPRDPSCGRAAL